MKRDFSEFSLRLGGSDGKESACNVGDQASIPGSGRSLGEINVNPLHYSCLENSMDRGAWQATVHGVTESDMTEHTYTELSESIELNLFKLHCYPFF